MTEFETPPGPLPLGSSGRGSAVARPGVNPLSASGDYAQRRVRARSAIEGGTASKRGARDHVQMIATIQGAPKRNEIPMLSNTGLSCLSRSGQPRVSATCSLNLHKRGTSRENCTPR